MDPVTRFVGVLIILLSALHVQAGHAHPAATTRTADPSTYASVVPTLQPGDTLDLAPGTYAGGLSIRNLNGSPGAWITIRGPAGGAPVVFEANAFSNTVEIADSSYVAVQTITLEGLHLDGPFGVSAKDGLSNLTHDIRIEGCTIRNYDGGQQTVGISTKTPTWGWVLRGNRIVNSGTGIYLGNSDGSCPFIGGLIEENLIRNPIGYCMQVKHQNARPTVPGMPTGDSVTIIRNNVFLKNDAPSPDGDRPNLLVGGFPDSGPGSNDLYEIYGNFLCHNPRESLFQGSGRVSLHDNVFVDVADTALLLRDHDLPLKLARVYNNTIYAAGSGILFGSLARQGDAVIGNLVFAGAPIGGTITLQRDNLTDAPTNAPLYVAAPSTTLGAMDFYPRVGQCQGSALDLSAFSGETDYAADFNGTSKGSFAFRGAYAGEGTNPGWTLDAALKGAGPSSPPPPPNPMPGPPSAGGGGGGSSGGHCGASIGVPGGNSTWIWGLLLLAAGGSFRIRRRGHD